jgi:hypothetical protein
MVGIYSKIKNGLSWLENKAFKKLAPLVGNIGDIANSGIVQGIAGLASPALDAFMPGLGMGLNKGLNFLGGLGGIAKQAEQDYDDGMSLGQMGSKLMRGGYSTAKKRDNLKGLNLARNISDLNPLIELKSGTKALMPPMNDNGSFVEELD